MRACCSMCQKRIQNRTSQTHTRYTCLHTHSYCYFSCASCAFELYMHPCPSKSGKTTPIFVSVLVALPTSSGSSSDSTTTMVPVTRPINNALKANQQRRQATSSPVVVVAAAAAAAAAASSLGSIDDDILASLPVVAPSNYNHAAPTPTASNAHLAIGTRVIVPSLCVIGTLRFLGNTKFKPGTWAGIELDVEGAGKNNGSVQGVRYFSCPEHTGLFVPASKAAPLPSGMEDDDQVVKVHRAVLSRTKPSSLTATPISTTRSKNCCSHKRAHASPIIHTCATANQMRKTRAAAAAAAAVTTITTSPSPTPAPSPPPLREGQVPRRALGLRASAAPLRKTTVPTPSRSRRRRHDSDELTHRRTAVPKYTSPNTPRRMDGLCNPQPTRSSSLAVRPSSDDGTSPKRPSSAMLKPTRSSGTRRAKDGVTVAQRQHQRQTVVPKTTTTPSAAAAAAAAATKLTRRGSNDSCGGRSNIRKSVVPAMASRSTATARRTDSVGGGLLRRKSTVPQVMPTRSKSTMTTTANTAAGASAARLKNMPQTATSRSTTTRRTKHTVHKPSPDEEQLRRLLEESRKEHAKLCEELLGKEAAWERTLSTKESYAIQVKEQQREMERLKSRIAELEAVDDRRTKTTTDPTDYRATVESQNQRIERLDRLVLQLQADAAKVQQQHREEIQNHMARAAQCQRDHDAVRSALEQDYRVLEQDRLETLRRYEAQCQTMVDEHRRALEMKDAELAALRRDLEQRPTVLMVEKEDTASAERCRRLEHQLQLTTSELDRERSAHMADAQEMDSMGREIQRLCEANHRTSLQVDQLQRDLAKEVADKRRVMEDAQKTQIRSQRLQDQHEQIWLAKQKLEHDFAEAVRRVATLEQKLAALERQHDTGWLLSEIDRLAREVELQEKRCRTLETDKSRLQDMVDKRRRRRRSSSGFQSPASPVSLTSYSTIVDGPDAKDQVYCEICEIFGHDVLSCTAYMMSTAPVPAGPTHDRHSTYYSYCVNCDVFGSHPTEDCPNQDEMF